MNHFLYFFQIFKELLFLSAKADIKTSGLSYRFSLLRFKTLTAKAWWRLTGSNRRPPACKAGALPAELNPHSTSITFAMLRCSTACVPTLYTALSRASPGSILEPDCMMIRLPPRSVDRSGKLCLVGLVGLEPTTPALSTRCSNQLSYRPDLVCFGPRRQARVF